MLMIPLKKAFSQLKPWGKTCSIENTIETFHHLYFTIDVISTFSVPFFLAFFKFFIFFNASFTVNLFSLCRSDILDFSVTVTTATGNPAILTH